MNYKEKLNTQGNKTVKEKTTDKIDEEVGRIDREKDEIKIL